MTAEMVTWILHWGHQPAGAGKTWGEVQNRWMGISQPIFDSYPIHDSYWFGYFHPEIPESQSPMVFGKSWILPCIWRLNRSPMLTTCWRTDACRARWFTIYPSVFTCQSARRGNWKTTPGAKQWHEAPHAALRSNMSRCQGMPRWGRNPFPQLQETTLSFLKGYLATWLPAGCIRISWHFHGEYLGTTTS